MSQVQVHYGLDPKEYQAVMEAMVRVAKTAKKEIEIDLPTRAANAFRNLLTKNILQQKYAGSGWGYSKKYASWKAKRKNSGYLYLDGDLVKNIKIVPRGAFWVVEIPATATDSGGKSYGKGRSRSIAFYARMQEYGGRFGNQRHKPRPVWKPTREEFEKEGWLRELKISMDTIRKDWRR